jgi:hypothetical protein
MIDHWINRCPGFFPFPLTIVTAALTYGLILALHQWVANSAVAVMVLSTVVAVFVFFSCYRYISFLFNVPTTPRLKQIIVFDIFVALIHALGLVTFGIIALSNPTDQHFSNIPAGARGYHLYFTFALKNAFFVFGTVGNGNISGVTALGAFAEYLSLLAGIIFLILIVPTFVVRYLWVPVAQHPQESHVAYQPPLKNRRPPRHGRGIPLVKHK